MVIQVRNFNPDNISKLVMVSVEEAIKTNGKATICVNASDNTLKVIAVLAANMPQEVLENLHLFFLDERVYPAGSEDRTDYKVTQEWIKYGPAPKFIHSLINDHNQLETSLSVAQKEFDQHVHGKSFDLVITDIDNDGSFGSLLPESEALTSEQDIIVIDHPEHPPTRVTYTMKVVVEAKRRVMIALGKSRGAILGRAASSKYLRKKIPITYLPKENSSWFVDEDGLFEFFG